MTFKHISFGESEVMRSFEKIAFDKGLVSPALKKKAAKQEAENLSPSTDLLQNVVKLCSGLQKAGLDSFSKELETAFFTFKSAQNDLYHAHKETGENLIDQAHPEGSHKMEDMIGDAEFETVIDQHLKMLDMVNKKPSGKLSSAKDVIRAVKIVLAEDDAVVNSLRSLLGSLNLIQYSYQKIESAFSNPLTWVGPATLIGAGIKEFTKPESPEQLIRRVEAFLKIGQISSDQAQKLKIDVNHLFRSYKPAYLNLTGLDKETFEEMGVYFDRANLALDNLIKAASSPKPVGSAAQSIKAMERAQEMAAFNRLRFNARTKVDQLKQKAQSIQSPEFNQHRNMILQWADNKKATVEDLAATLSNRIESEEKTSGVLAPERKKEVINAYSEMLNKELSALDFQLNQLQEWK